MSRRRCYQIAYNKNFHNYCIIEKLQEVHFIFGMRAVEKNIA